MDILEKALFHEEDLVIPLPKATKQPHTPSTTTSPHLEQQLPPTTDNKPQLDWTDPQPPATASSTDQGGNAVDGEVPLMKVPALLDVEMIVSSTDVIRQVSITQQKYNLNLHDQLDYKNARILNLFT